MLYYHNIWSLTLLHTSPASLLNEQLLYDQYVLFKVFISYSSVLGVSSPSIEPGGGGGNPGVFFELSFIVSIVISYKRQQMYDNKMTYANLFTNI